MTERNLLVVQGGGPTQVLNATLAAIVEEARAQRKFTRVYGARQGIRGLVQGGVADLNDLSAAELALLRVSPGAALGSSRAKPSEVQDPSGWPGAADATSDAHHRSASLIPPLLC